MEHYDAIVVGAGHNGLVSALYLARAGWSVLVLERAPTPGGAVQSAELTLPGVVHDVFATNMNLFRGSPVAAELGDVLERHGLEYATSSLPFANVYPDGASLRVLADRDATIAGLAAHDARDGAGWEALDAAYERLAPSLFALYGSRLDGRSLLRRAAEIRRSLGARGALAMAELLLSSTRELAEGHLATREAHALVASWGMHLDFGPDVSGGAMFPFLEAFTDMRTGISLARGGAGRLTGALVGALAAAGGRLRVGAEVARIVVAGGRAVAVELAGGERIAAGRATVANVTPTALYDGLLAGAAVDPSIRGAARAYRYGPGTMMVHLTLSGPLEWRAGADLGEFAYVHVAPYLEDLGRTYADACAGILPAEPLLVVGQSTAVDPTRAPAGTHVVWVQVRAVPSQISGDALGEIAGRRWEEAGEPYAERVIEKLERYAPGTRSRILARAILTPADLERANPNLRGGDSLAGSMHLRQTFVLRPFAAARDYETGVEGLLLTGAATWPGAGVNALSGYHVAHKLLAPRRRVRDDARLLGEAARALARRVS